MITTHFFSASQITLYRDCQRKWGWKYLAFLSEPQSFAGQLGDAVDSGQLQPYLRAGTPFDYTRQDQAGYIAASALQHLPKPGTPGLEVQKWFQFPSPWSIEGGVARWGYQGYIDLWLPNGGMPEHPGPTVSDFKCTKSFDYALDESELAADVQANLYGTWAMHTTGAREIDLVWLYMSTGDTRKSLPVHVHAHAEDVIRQLRAIDETAAEMYEHVADAPKGPALDDYILDLPPNPQVCQKYGRPCAFTDRCNLSPDQIVESLAANERARNRRRLPTVTEGETNMSATLDAIRARRAAALGQAAPPAPAALPINPPEAALPPAPPVGVAASAPAPAPAEAPKRRGRPAKVAVGSAATPPVQAPVAESGASAQEAHVTPTIDRQDAVHDAVSGLIVAAANLGEAIRAAAEALKGAA